MSQNNIKQLQLSHMQKLTKYILMGLIVVIATRYIPDNIIDTKEIIMIGATSSIAFAILDMISPAIHIQQVKDENSSTKKALVEA